MGEDNQRPRYARYFFVHFVITTHVTLSPADIDIITFDLAQRMPVQLKIPKVREAISRGIHFEITYSSALTGTLGC